MDRQGYRNQLHNHHYENKFCRCLNRLHNSLFFLNEFYKGRNNPRHLRFAFNAILNKIFEQGC